MLSKCIIQHSKSAFSSPVLLVKKKDKTWHFCVDYRHLNALTVKFKYPVSEIDQLLDELHGAAWFSSLDLKAGFHQILLKPGEDFKKAFQTHVGQFKFRVMTFGLTGAPNSFQEAMNTTLGPLLRKCVLVFFDDILVYNPTFEDHLTHLQQVFELLSAYQWRIKLSKCSFAQNEVSYLGHVIIQQGVATDSNKISTISSWSTPINVKELRSFLGTTGYYRKFVKNFGVISRPLTNLLKKGTLFVWTHDHDLAFTTLQQALVTTPVLALPNFHKPFVIETDSNDYGFGAMLLQDGHPLAFISKARGPNL
jgi:hypothetical protein